jgi:hypothetical protein
VALSQEDIAFIKTHMAEWLTEQSLGKPAAVYEIELQRRFPDSLLPFPDPSIACPSHRPRRQHPS